MNDTQRKTIADYSKLYHARYEALQIAEEFKVDNLTEDQKEDYDFYRSLLDSDFKYLARFEKYWILMNVLEDVEKGLGRCEAILQSADWHI